MKEALAAEDPTSDLDDESATSEDFTVEVSGSASQPNISLYDEDDDDEESVTPPTHTKKRKKSQSADSTEYQKVKILQQMSNAFLAGRSRPVSDSDATFVAQIAEELRSIKSPAIKTTVKRKIMNDLYEAQECDQPSMLPPMFYPPSVQMPHTQPSPPTYPQPLPHHPPPPPALPHHQYQPPLGHASWR